MELREKRRRKVKRDKRKKYFEKCAVSVCLFLLLCVFVLNKWRRLRILRSIYFCLLFIYLFVP